MLEWEAYWSYGTRGHHSGRYVQGLPGPGQHVYSVNRYVRHNKYLCINIDDDIIPSPSSHYQSNGIVGKLVLLLSQLQSSSTMDSKSRRSSRVL